MFDRGPEYDEAPNEICDSFIKSSAFACPKCGTAPDSRPNLYDNWGYIIDDVAYPLIYNRSTGSTMDGMYDDWDEYHICHECETKFWFRDGVY